jgi:hypothetical protein
MTTDVVDSEGNGVTSCDSDGTLGGQSASPERARPTTSEPLLSVVVATCAGVDSTLRCIEAILRSDTRRFEVVVVENRPAGSAVRRGMQERTSPLSGTSPERLEPRSRGAAEGRRGLGSRVELVTDSPPQLDIGSAVGRAQVVAPRFSRGTKACSGGGHVRCWQPVTALRSASSKQSITTVSTFLTSNTEGQVRGPWFAKDLRTRHSRGYPQAAGLATRRTLRRLFLVRTILSPSH